MILRKWEYQKFQFLLRCHRKHLTHRLPEQRHSVNTDEAFFQTSLSYGGNEEVSTLLSCVFQNASAGVSRMLLGNKCDIEAKRKVSKEVGEKVSCILRPIGALSKSKMVNL